MFETVLHTSDGEQQREERRGIRFRKEKPNVVFISPQVIGAKNQLRKCAPPLGLASLAAVLEERNICDGIHILDAAVEDYDNVQTLEDNPNFIKFGMSDESPPAGIISSNSARFSLSDSNCR